jgi:cell filamentation protein
VTFDPFGDFETQGYLRNLTKEKDPEIVRHLEHASFMTGIDAALERLAKIKHLSYSDLLETHRILFEAVYPWAGQDRRTTAPILRSAEVPFFLLILTRFNLRQTMDSLVGKTKNS